MQHVHHLLKLGYTHRPIPTVVLANEDFLCAAAIVATRLPMIGVHPLQHLAKFPARFAPGFSAAGMPDYNTIYFNLLDLSEDLESDIKQRALSALSTLGVEFDVKNKGCVCSFYPRHFGRPCPPLQSA